MTRDQAREWLRGLGLADVAGKAALFERVHATLPARRRR